MLSEMFKFSWEIAFGKHLACWKLVGDGFIAFLYKNNEEKKCENYGGSKRVHHV